MLCSASWLAAAAVTASSHSTPSSTEADDQPDNLTIITTQGADPRNDQLPSRPSDRGHLYAVAPNGSTVFETHRFHDYWDVDPVKGTSSTVMVSTSEALNDRCPENWCVRMRAQQINVSTGETETIWSRVINESYTKRYHDIDRYNETHLVVADIANDRLFLVNHRTDEVTWSWSFENIYSHKQGGKPGDWTHVNDVEVLEDGTIMADPRNMDEVVFVKPGEGYLANWTLGEDGNHTILYEQHNPDYIPQQNGGPAVLVADSQNNRIVEYQRENGEWEQSWVWSDAEMSWPRDADRLPNGHTLITDTNSQRVLEINETGDVIWQVEVERPYEAERLGTGDESSGGESASRLSLPNQQAGASAADQRFTEQIVGLLPAKMENGVRYVAPSWFGSREIVATAVGLLAGVLLALFELTRLGLRWRLPQTDCAQGVAK